MTDAVQFLLVWLALYVSTEISIAADPWTLWTKTEMFTLDAAEKKTSVGTFWRPAENTKESSSFDSKIQCESRRDYTISQFRAAQGTTEIPNGQRIIKVEGETILMITRFKDGEGNSIQQIELTCRSDSPTTG